MVAVGLQFRLKDRGGFRDLTVSLTVLLLAEVESGAAMSCESATGTLGGLTMGI
jgi:hypothetical protein